MTLLDGLRCVKGSTGPIVMNQAHIRPVLLGNELQHSPPDPPDREARPMSTLPNALSRRAIAMLKAIGEGRAELRCSCEPDLRVDGLSCCDQNTAHDLARAGLVRATR